MRAFLVALFAIVVVISVYLMYISDDTEPISRVGTNEETGEGTGATSGSQPFSSVNEPGAGSESQSDGPSLASEYESDIRQYSVLRVFQLSRDTQAQLRDVHEEDVFIFDLGVYAPTGGYHYFVVGWPPGSAAALQTIPQQVAVAAFEVYFRRRELMSAALQQSSTRLAQSHEEARTIANELRESMQPGDTIVFQITSDGREAVLLGSEVYTDEELQWWELRLEALSKELPEGWRYRTWELFAPPLGKG